MIELKHISVRFSANEVLHDIDCRIEPGARLALLGPNGAGKSTLLKVIGRMVSVSSGQVILNGNLLEKFSRRNLSKQINYVPQLISETLVQSVFEFVLLGRFAHYGWNRPCKQDLEIVEEVIYRTNLQALRNRSIFELSGGERQKVLIAAALAQQANILLLDEPTTFLDPRAQGEILELINVACVDPKLTVIMATHDVNLATGWASQIMALKSGRLISITSPKDFIGNEMMESLFGRRFLRFEHSSRPTDFLVAE